jgi:hypothetical protein
VATPTRTAHRIPGAAGPIRIEVCSGSRVGSVPAVIFREGLTPSFPDRVARAGLSAVRFTPSGSTTEIEAADQAAVVAALEAGALGISKPSSIAFVQEDSDGLIARLCRELR